MVNSGGGGIDGGGGYRLPTSYAWLVMQIAFVTVTKHHPDKQFPVGLLGGRLGLHPEPVDLISNPLGYFENVRPEPE